MIRRQQNIILCVLVISILSTVLAGDLCVTDTFCTKECKSRGFLDDGIKCRLPTIQECEKDLIGCANALSGENKACKVLGMEKNTSDDACHIPISCTASGKMYCSEPNKPCVLNGYVLGKTGTDCVAPTLQDCRGNQQKCIDDQSACVIMGFSYDTKDPLHKCLEPDCFKAAACKDPKVVCTSLGYTKNDNDTCSCDEPLQVKIKNACHSCESETEPCTSECLSVGWITKNQQCVEPEQCDDSEKSHCKNANSICQSFFGFTKESDSDACECLSPKTVRYNRCVSLSYSNSVQQIIFSVSALFLFILV